MTGAPIRLLTRCPNAQCRTPIHSAIGDNISLKCPACGADALPHADAAWRTDSRVERCPCCNGTEFFVRKDFPQRFGLAVVVAAAILSFILLTRHTLVALGLLASVVALDALIYLFVGRVTVCYRCRAEFRGVRYNPAHTAFDLATAEKYPKPGV